MARSKQIIGTRISDYVTMGVLARHLSREAVLKAVEAGNRQSIRNRKLPAELVTLYCTSLWLYRDVAYEDVLDCLLESWRWLGLKGSEGATKGAISLARDRLGPEPMRLLFDAVAVPLATMQTLGAWYEGKRLVAMDGTLFDTPDTLKNGEAFGYPSNGRQRGAFPKVRAVVLSEVGTHAPFGCAIGSYTTSEVELSRELLGKILPDMLLLADRYYFGPSLWRDFAATGATLLWRIASNDPVEILDRLPDGSYRARLRYDGPETFLRIVAYQLKGSEEQIRLATNEMDPAKAPAAELAGLYPQRWEAEHLFDEIKSHLNEARLALRSKKPALIEQEIWGLMLLHWTLRELMHEAAQVHERDPDTISFVKTVRLVKLRFTKDGGFSP